MTMAKVLMRSVGVAAVLAAAGIPQASAQQMIAPASATPVPGPMPDILQKYAPVTAERLKKPEDANWLMFRRTFDGWGYSPLADITPDNVGRLQPVWSFATGQSITQVWNATVTQSGTAVTATNMSYNAAISTGAMSVGDAAMTLRMFALPVW